MLRSAQHWLAGTRLVGRLWHAIFRQRVRRRVVELDHLSVARSQKRILLGLVHQASGTRFGRDHDFRRIRTLEDFRRLVPLQTPASLWKDCWQAAFPRLAGTTWPEPNGAMVFCPERATADRLAWVPVSAGLCAAHQKALRTALGLATHSGAGSSRFTGMLCYLGCGTGPAWSPGVTMASTWEDVFGRDMVGRLQAPAVLTPTEGTGPQGLAALVRRSAGLPVQWLLGSAERLIQFATLLKQETGRDRLVEIWPTLTAILCLSGAAVDRTSVAAAAGADGVRVLEEYLPPEGPVAVLDPRHGRLRLLPDHGVFFEFVPAHEVGRSRPTRLEAAEVEAGVPYAVALTSPAGIWACMTGARVCFESRDPPLLQLLASSPEEVMRPEQERSAAIAAAHPFPVQPPHPRNGRTPRGQADRISETSGR